tara:strand:- start:254 stop:655 length:402 start_codon:yes stop_codon:yes gene_type:complete
MEGELKVDEKLKILPKLGITKQKKAPMAERSRKDIRRKPFTPWNANPSRTLVLSDLVVASWAEVDSGYICFHQFWWPAVQVLICFCFNVLFSISSGSHDADSSDSGDNDDDEIEAAELARSCMFRCIGSNGPA